MKELAIGIDLGTTNSVVAYINEKGSAEVIKNSNGTTITPSVVLFSSESEVIVGAEAKRLISLEKENVALFFKRDMGTDAFVTYHGRDYTPVDISAGLLRKIKSDAERNIGTEISKAVITVPAYFENQAREDTKRAAELAGIEVLKIINEPTAAALAYGMGKLESQETVLVYDLGGGTFDISLMEISQGSLSVIGSYGNHNLGGKNWDDRLVNYICQEFERRNNCDPCEEAYTFQEILTEVEMAKKALSGREKVSVRVNCQGISDRIEITRELFEELTRDLLCQTEILMQQAVEESAYTYEDISSVLMVGGSTRMPMCREMVKRITGKEPNYTLNLDECVALGAAIQADLILREHGNNTALSPTPASGLVKLQDVNAHSLGMVVISANGDRYENAIILPKNTPIPAVDSQIKVLSTSPGDENELEIYLLQGESIRPLDNNVLGKYTFTGIPHYSGKTRIEIRYQYDANGIVNIVAYDERSGKQLRLSSIERRGLDISWTDEPPRTQKAFEEMYIMLCIDTSGSMEGRKLDEAKAGALDFMKHIDLEYSSIGLMTFESRAKRQIKFTKSVKAMKNVVRTLKTGSTTNMAEALQLAHADIVGMKGRRVIVLLTDGLPDSRRDTLSIAKTSKDDGIEIITIGTDGADQVFLKKLATSDADQFFASIGDLREVFGKIARNLSESRRGMVFSQ